MKKLRKILTISVMMMTVLSMSVVVVPEVDAAASAGDLIKMDGLSSVYYLGSDSKRYVFPNEATYFSWYSDWSGVVTIPQSELESYPLGANVTMRAGTKLVKITTNPKVYAVESDGVLRPIPDEATAKALYGDDWNTMIVDVPDAFFTNYTISEEEVTSSAYPEGTMIQREGETDIYYIDAAGEARKVANEAAMMANRLNNDYVVMVAADYTLPTMGDEISAAEDGMVDTSQGGGAGVGIDPEAGTGLTVGLASDTPVAATIIAGQATAPLAKFTVTAANDGDVKITGVRLKRIGVSADATLSALYLYDGVNRLTDSATVSSTYISWNDASGIMTVPAGTSKTFMVKSNIATLTSGQTVGVRLESADDITTNGASVSGSFPMSGNIMSIATATLAGVSFATTSYPNSDGAPAPQTDFEVWKNNVSITTRAVDLYNITFRQVGSINTSDAENFKLYVDGVQVGDTVANMDANGYVTFDLTDAPKELKTGTRVMKVLADLVNGSTRTIQMSLRQAADVLAMDSEYEDANVLVQKDSSTFAACSATAQTIAAGSLTVTKKADSPSGNIVNAGTGVTLAAYELKATGERIKIETLDIAVDDSGNETAFTLRNGALFADGVQVGSTASIAGISDTSSSGYTRYTFGSSLIVEPGSPVTLEIRSDIYDDDGTNDVAAAVTLIPRIVAGSSNAQKMTSLSFFNVPSANVVANTLTVAEGSLSLAEYTGYADKSMVAPQTAYKFGEWRLTADTTEDVNLTALEIDWDNSTADVASDLSDAYLVYGDEETVVKATVTSTSDSYSINHTLASGDTLNIALYANLASGVTGTYVADLTVNGTAVGSTATANATETGGQTITATTGSIATAATEDPLDQMVYGGQTVTVANYDIVASNDDYTLEHLCVKVASGSQAAIDRIYLYDGTTLLNEGGTPMNGVRATTTGLELVIPGNTSKRITVKASLNPVGTGYATSGLNASTTLDSIKVRNSAGTQSYVNNAREGNSVWVFKTYPVVTHVALSAAERAIVNNQSQTVYKFKIAPSAGGEVDVKQLTFNVAWNDEGTSESALELESLKLYRGTTDITSIVDITDGNGDTAESTSGILEADTTAGIVIGFIASEERITSEQTYTLKATPKLFNSGTTSADSVSLTLVGDTSHTTNKFAVASVSDNKIWKLAPAATGAGTNATANFLWSDRSLVTHTSTSGGAGNDWFNGYKVEYLDLDATVMEK